MRRSAQGTHDVVDGVSGFEQGHLTGGLADGLDDQRNGPHLGVRVRDRQRDPLTVVRHADDDKLSGLSVRCDQWRVDDVSDDVGSELFSLADRIHAYLSVFVMYNFIVVYSKKARDIRLVPAKTPGTDGKPQPPLP